MKAIQPPIVLLCIAAACQTVATDSLAGQVVGWGQNVGGEATGVPSPDAYYSTGLVTVAGQVLRDVQAVSAGRGHSLALLSDRTVFGWGNNANGEITGLSTEYLHSATNGQVVLAGRLLSNVTSVVAGPGFSLALKSDGTVVAWGEGMAQVDRSQLRVPPGLNQVTSIAAGEGYGLALRRDGTVIGWGGRKVPLGLSNIVAIAAGGDHLAPSLALQRDGIVFEWSPGADFETARPAASNAVAIAAGVAHCLALQRDGTVFGWGGNGSGEATGVPTTTGSYAASGLVGVNGVLLRDVVAIAAGNRHSLALKQDGTLAAWGRISGLYPASVPAGLSNVVAIAAGGNFCLAITTNTAAWPPNR